MRDEAFNFVFNTIGKHTCVPSEGNKEKALGCYNAINDYGKEPTESACKRCWREWLEQEDD